MKQNLIPLSDLNLTDRFLFDEVMEDPQAHQDALSIIFGHTIPLLTQNETEKELRVSPAIRSIRMDVCSMDENKSIYNTEMQKKRQTDLAKRSRYYQAMIDTSLLEPGIPNYNILNRSFIIIITPFDPFGLRLYRYTFNYKCEERPECELNDGATKIFLNTRGMNPEEVSSELVEFLHYLENTTNQVAEHSTSDRIKRIHQRVQKVKSNEEIGVKYMQAWEEKYYEREEGREEGRAEGSKFKLLEQIIKKLRKDKTPKTIADELEEDEDTIQHLCAVAKNFAPGYDLEQIYNAIYKKEN